MRQEAAGNSSSNALGEVKRSEVRRRQRRRLERAVVEAVQRKGFAETTVADLVASAGVSKGTLYEIFKSRERCFLATFDEIAAEAMSRVGAAYRTGSGPEERLAAAIECLAELVAEYPGAASLLLVDSLSLGRPGADRRARLGAGFEDLFGTSFQASSRDEAPGLAARVFVSGVRRVVYGHLRRGEPERLRGHAGELVEWAVSYASHPPAVSTAAIGRAVIPVSDGGAPAWDEPPYSSRSREKLTQRERIIRAAAQIAAEEGFASLTIPAISTVSGTSNQTFYEHFASKEMAFRAAFDELARRAHRISTRTAAVEARGWPQRVAAYMRALLEHIAAEPIFAKVAFIELPAAGPAALDRADEVTGLFTSFLEPIGLPEDVEPLQPILVDAIGGGVRGAIQHEIAAGDLARLPEKAAALVEIALAPLHPRPAPG